MYKQSQLTRLDRLAATCRVVSIIALATAMLVLIVIIGPVLSQAGQILLGLGTVIFAWWIVLSRSRKQATATRIESQTAEKYSLDFD